MGGVATKLAYEHLGISRQGNNNENETITIDDNGNFVFRCKYWRCFCCSRATLQHKSTVVTKKPMPKSTVSTINVSKVNSTKKSTFRPLVTKPAPKPVSKVSSKPAAKPAASSAKPKSSQKTVNSKTCSQKLHLLVLSLLHLRL